MNNLKTVIQQLKSEKIKERQEGLAGLRTAFQRDAAVLSLDETGDGRAWLLVFQALFTAVLNERDTYTKPSKSKGKSALSGAAAARRLADAASAVRWLIARAVQRLNRKAVRPVIAHLMQTLVYNGQLLAPVALDYVKALRSVVGYNPHVDHLEEEAWLSMVEMSFNVVLGDPVRQSLDAENEDSPGKSFGSPAPGEESDEENFDELFDEDSGEDADMSPSSHKKHSMKRKWQATRATPRPTAESSRSSRSKAAVAVSLEQIEFASLLAALLSAPATPLLSPAHPYLSNAVLTRLSRFLVLHHSATSASLHSFFLQALSATLAHVALNRRKEVDAFVKSSWEGLIELWGTKNKSMKEPLVYVLRTLFPFYTAPALASTSEDFSWAEGVTALWYKLDAEAESRWGVDGLDIDKLRLEVAADREGMPPFSTATFRAGWAFDTNQALAWAILELQANCVEKLFLFSESTHLSNHTSFQRKRAKFEHPITGLLSSIISPTASVSLRLHHLRVLLFFVSRHWLILHSSFQSDILSSLVQLVTSDEAALQNWVFMCIAAIADAVSTTSNNGGAVRDARLWDPVWTHAIRRVNQPAISRVACHTARVLLQYSSSRSTSMQRNALLTYSRILVEIEALAKDLDVQGPTAPSDAVCAFFAACLRVASQDVRLYRMQMEEKVLSWLLDAWNRYDLGNRTKMPLYTVGDMLMLLESICVLSKKSDIISRIPLPECPIVHHVVEDEKSSIIMNFVLSAKLPRFRHTGVSNSAAPAFSMLTVEGSASAAEPPTADLAPPRGRERRISAFMLKFLESHTQDWETAKDSPALYRSAESVRRTLDIAVIALFFEFLLVQNGISSNRRVVQAACKTISVVTPMLSDARWTAQERALILLSLEPLVAREHILEISEEWEALLPPEDGSGIKREKLMELLDGRPRPKQSRTGLHKFIWQSVDVQDISSSLMNTLRQILRIVVGKQSIKSLSSDVLEVDDKDGFGAIRTTQDAIADSATGGLTDSNLSNSYLVEVCVQILVVGPVLQSASGEPTRDKELTEIFLNCPEEEFLSFASLCFLRMQEKTLNLTSTGFHAFLDKFESLLMQYKYSRSESLLLLTAQFLDSTLHLWLQKSVASTETGENSRKLCRWLSQTLRGKTLRSWRVKDRVTRFLDRYLSCDPWQAVWSLPLEDGDSQDISELPVSMLNALGADEDIRIRFRAAVANAHLFGLARTIGQDDMILYHDIKAHLTVDIDNYEHMLTRLLTLGNVMAVSSAVRRGPYWHLLETSLVGSGVIYVPHIQAILQGISERLGLQGLSDLFVAYASQIAYSIRQALLDFLRFPPSLLGYDDRKQCAEAAFHAFTPTNVLADGSPKTVTHGMKLFTNHCKAIQRTTLEGIEDCFGDIIGTQVVFWMDQNLNPSSFDELQTLLRSKTAELENNRPFDEYLEANVDAIMIAILRTLGDQDCSVDGSVSQALRLLFEDKTAVQTFKSVVRFRHLEKFAKHPPNLPSFSAVTVLRALRWFESRTATADSRATTYHIVHHFFAYIQRSFLVNEQLRLLTALCLWISCHPRDFKDPAILRTLMLGSASLLGQFDLARAAQSILDWSLDIYSLLSQEDMHLTDLLIQIGFSAHHLATAGRNLEMADTGRDMLIWLDQKAVRLSTHSHIRRQIAVAASAWSHQPSSELLAICDDVPPESVLAVLDDHRIVSNKFRLIRRLRDFAKQGVYSTERFAVADFWKLKDSIPSPDQIQDVDIIAFADLLSLQKGKIRWLDSDTSQASLRSRQRRSTVRSRDVPEQSPHRAIVFSLLAILERSDPSQVYAAYSTLRLLMSVQSSEIPAIHTWPSEYKQELGYLEKYTRNPKPPVPSDILELSNTPPDLSSDFPRWIVTATGLLANILAATDPFFAQLTSILEVDVDFAEQILPILVHTVLQLDPLYQPSDASYRIVLSRYFSTVLNCSIASSSSVRCIIDIVLHLRHFPPSSKKDPLGHDKWLEIDYILLAKNAVTYGAYTTALLFLELATEYQATPSADNSAVEQVMFAIYSHIDEPDGFYGIRTQDLRQFLMKRFHHEQQWEKAFRFHGAALEAGNKDPTEAEGLLSSFHAFGFDHLAMQAVQGRSVDLGVDSQSSSMSYQLGWRTSTWDLPDQTESLRGASLYMALRGVHRERHPQVVDSILRSVLYDEMTRLSDLGNENLAEIREATQTLMCLNEVIQWRMKVPSAAARDIHQLPLDRLCHIDGAFEFPDLENIMATRISLLQSVRRKEQRSLIGSMQTPLVSRLIEIEKRCLIRVSEAARDSNRPQIALNSIVRAQKLESSPSADVSQEFSSVLWAQKEEKLAIQSLTDLVTPNDTVDTSLNSAERTQKALLLARLGEWISEACLEKPTDIKKRFFDPASRLISNAPQDPAHAIVYHQCAVFAEHQYKAIEKSPDLLRRKLYIDRKENEIKNRAEQLIRLQEGTRQYLDQERDKAKAEVLLREDRQLYRRHIETRDAFLMQAIDMYARCLEADDKFDDDGAIRLCSLWFANFEETELQDSVHVALDRVASRKFVFLAHQLSARLSTRTTPSQQNLLKLLLRMCQDHPFHSLYQVYCLGLGRASSEPRRVSSRHESASQVERSGAAGGIFDRLRNSENHRQRACDIEKVCDASLEWAQHPIRNDSRYNNMRQKAPFRIPDKLLIRKIANIKVPVITSHTPLDATLRYEDCAWIEGFDPSFDTAGGINLPKITTCLGCDGIKYKQLYKGEGADDMRQDAVMEQVFELVSKILHRDRETKRRNLNIRGYKVIPLAAQAGVLEFVGNTVPLQSWLQWAHPKYRPQDISVKEGHHRLREKRKECGGRPDVMLALFLELRKRFKPVMRQFFVEKHKTPMSWFSMRLNYIRSVATTSIVGHVLGLGDRHVSNILIDNGTGEVVHIDLGIAFEQGRLLLIPECIPFRLTADMVDGMGISGTQGVFQRCAEHTLRVLREGSEIIMAVLEVFKHDPLYIWTANEMKLRRVQGTNTHQPAQETTRYGLGIDMSSGYADEDADRALSSVVRKLEKTLSVEYTVNELIAEATDPGNLALMFFGWSPLY